MVDEVMFASGSEEWGTPRGLIAALERLFGPFDLDPCCRLREFAKAPTFYSDGGLERPWGENTFCNPPWSKKKPIDPWVEKASRSRSTMLIPARTDTRWFRKCFERAAAIAFISGRLRYEILETADERLVRHAAAAAKGDKASDGTTAPFPSCIVHFDPRYKGSPNVGLMSTTGELLV